MLADVLSNRENSAFLELKTFWDYAVLYRRLRSLCWRSLPDALRHLDLAVYTVGKPNTQIIKPKHLTLRAKIKRLALKTICFSTSIWSHDCVTGLFINCYEFGLNL
jgi:insertion element IS1 protein InsB